MESNDEDTYHLGDNGDDGEDYKDHLGLFVDVYNFVNELLENYEDESDYVEAHHEIDLSLQFCYQNIIKIGQIFLVICYCCSLFIYYHTFKKVTCHATVNDTEQLKNMAKRCPIDASSLDVRYKLLRYKDIKI